MTATAERPKSAAALRKELARARSSRETFQHEVDSASTKRDAALGAEDTSAAVRWAGRLADVRELVERQSERIDQLAAELAEAEAKEAREETLRTMAAIARDTREAVGRFDERFARLNEHLSVEIGELLQASQRIYEGRRTFVEALEQLAPGVMNCRTLPSREPAEEAVQTLRSRGVSAEDLAGVLYQWPGSPPSWIDGPFSRPLVEPFGWLIAQGIDGLQRREALERQPSLGLLDGGAQ